MTAPTELTRPIIGIENRTAQEVFDIMCDRIRSALVSVPAVPDAGEETERKLATVVAPDNGTVEEVFAAILQCANAWVPEARIIGNVRAGDIARAVSSALAASHMPVGERPPIERRYVLEWTAGARPPVFPKPMRGTQSFVFFEDAVAFMARQASDSQFVSLIELVTSKIDRSDDARKTLAAARAGEDG